MAAQVPSRLYRSRSQKMLSGVCGGLGEYFDVDPVLIRLLFVVTSFISGAGILAYIVLWIVVPFEGDDSPRLDALRRDFNDVAGRVREYVDPPRTGHAAGLREDTPSGAATGATAGGAPAADATPSATPDPAAAAHASASGHADSDSTAHAPTSHPYEDASMTSDSTSSRVTSPDEPRTADELTLGEEPHEPRPVGSTATAAGSPRTEAAGGPYSSPYGPPYGPAGGGTTYGSTSPFGPGGPGAYGSDASAYASDPAGFAAAPPPPTDRKRRRQHWAGAILVLIGVLILGNNLGLLWWVQPEFLLPLILVGAGGWLLFGRGRRG